MGGIALIVIGIGYLLFGGTTSTGQWIELFGFRFGRGESEPMSRAQSLFWGIAFIVAGVVLLKFSWAAG